jgi:hypothetical protein
MYVCCLSLQAKELLDHLEDVLSNKPIEVISGNTIVEAKPQVGRQSSQGCGSACRHGLLQLVVHLSGSATVVVVADSVAELM